MSISFQKITLTLASTAIVLSLATKPEAAEITSKVTNLQVLGSTQGNQEETAQLIAEVNLAEMSADKDVLSVTWSIKNTGDTNVVLTWLHQGSYTYTGSFLSGVTASSPETKTKYHPLMDGVGECVCSGNISSDFTRNLSPEEKLTYWSLYPTQKEVETVTIEIPGFDPIEDIPIS